MSVAGNDMAEVSVAKVGSVKVAGIAMVHDDQSKLETVLNLGTGTAPDIGMVCVGRETHG